MTQADDKRYRPHVLDEPRERPTSRRVVRKRHARWASQASPFDFGIAQVEWEEPSSWSITYLTMLCGCRVTKSAMVRPWEVYGFWTGDCTGDADLHEQALWLGIGALIPEAA